MNCWILFRWVRWAGLGWVGVGGHPIRVDRVDTGHSEVRTMLQCFIASLIITQHDEPLQLQRCSVRVCRACSRAGTMAGVVSSEHYLCHDSHCGCAAACWAGALWAVIHPEYSVTFYRGAAPTPTSSGCCRPPLPSCSSRLKQ